MNWKTYLQNHGWVEGHGLWVGSSGEVSTSWEALEAEFAVDRIRERLRDSGWKRSDITHGTGKEAYQTEGWTIANVQAPTDILSAWEKQQEREWVWECFGL